MLNVESIYSIAAGMRCKQKSTALKSIRKWFGVSLHYQCSHPLLSSRYDRLNRVRYLNGPGCVRCGFSPNVADTSDLVTQRKHAAYKRIRFFLLVVYTSNEV